jgi:hypothetical protein
MAVAQIQVVTYYAGNRRLFLGVPVAPDWPSRRTETFEGGVRSAQDRYTSLGEVRDWLAMGNRVKVEAKGTRADVTPQILAKIAAYVVLPGMTEAELLALILPRLRDDAGPCTCSTCQLAKQHAERAIRG